MLRIVFIWVFYDNKSSLERSNAVFNIAREYFQSPVFILTLYVLCLRRIKYNYEFI